MMMLVGGVFATEHHLPTVRTIDATPGFFSNRRSFKIQSRATKIRLTKMERRPDGTYGYEWEGGSWRPRVSDKKGLRCFMKHADEASRVNGQDGSKACGLPENKSAKAAFTRWVGGLHAHNEYQLLLKYEPKESHQTWRAWASLGRGQVLRTKKHDDAQVRCSVGCAAVGQTAVCCAPSFWPR